MARPACRSWLERAGPSPPARRCRSARDAPTDASGPARGEGSDERRARCRGRRRRHAGVRRDRARPRAGRSGPSGRPPDPDLPPGRRAGRRRTTPGSISATPAAFVEQVDALSRRFTFVSLQAVLDRLAGGATDAGPVDPADLRRCLPRLRRGGLARPRDRGRSPSCCSCRRRSPTGRRRSGGIACTPRSSPRRDPSRSRRRGRPCRWPTRADRVAAFRTLRGELKSLDHPSAMAEVDRIVGWLGDPALRSSVLGWDELRRLAGEGVTLAAPFARPPAAGTDRSGRAGRRDRGLLGGPRPRDRRGAGGVRLPERQPLRRGRARVEALGIQAAFTTVRGVNDLRRADGTDSDGSTSAGARARRSSARRRSAGWPDEPDRATHRW